MGGAQQQLDGAIAAEAWEDAAALQEELTAGAQQAAALAAAHGFQPLDAADLVQQLAPAAPPPPPTPATVTATAAGSPPPAAHAEGSASSTAEDRESAGDGMSAAPATGKNEELQVEEVPAAEAENEAQAGGAPQGPAAPAGSGEPAGAGQAAQEAVAADVVVDGEASGRECLPPLASTAEMEGGYASGNDNSTSEAAKSLSALPGGTHASLGLCTAIEVSVAARRVRISAVLAYVANSRCLPHHQWH